MLTSHKLDVYLKKYHKWMLAMYKACARVKNKNGLPDKLSADIRVVQWLSQYW